MFSSMRRIAAIAALVTAVGLLTTVAGTSAAGASQPQRRQLAITTLSDFKVVLTATREAGHPLLATVTAVGFRRSGSGWQLIAIKRIGKASGWSWVLGGYLLAEGHPVSRRDPDHKGGFDKGQPADHTGHRLLRHLQQNWTP